MFRIFKFSLIFVKYCRVIFLTSKSAAVCTNDNSEIWLYRSKLPIVLIVVAFS